MGQDIVERINGTRVGDRIVVGADDLAATTINTLAILDEDGKFGPGVWLRVSRALRHYKDFTVTMRADDRPRAFRLIRPVEA